MSIKDMQEIKKGKYEEEKPGENYTQVKNPATTVSKVEPEKESMMEEDKGMMSMGGGDMMEEEGKEMQIDSNSLPALRKWQVGQSYPVKLIMVGTELADDGKTIIGKFKIK